jgi:hypothetical protein
MVVVPGGFPGDFLGGFLGGFPGVASREIF